MASEVVTLNPDAPDWAKIEHAARALADGALVGFPTETVYGLAANAACEEAVRRLQVLKGRAASQPFTIHIGRRSECDDFVPEMTPIARRLTRKAWPGPLTIVFPVGDPTRTKAYGILSKSGIESVYADNTVGVRYPDHRVAEHLLTSAGAPIVASSANPAGGPPPTDGAAVREALADKVDIVLDAGPTRYRKASTIVALNGDGYKVLREGVLDERMIRRFATVNILFVCTGNTCRSPMAAALCGQMLAEKLGCRPDELASRGIIIHSAGTLGICGGRASPEAIEVCRKAGLDISSHVPRGLDVELIHPADYIFTMARHHLDVIRSLAPGDADKAQPLHPDEDISDPMGGSVEDYQRAADKIKEALTRRMAAITV
ncbi:MAG TPA: L-threonylcarbamoyladenylate synthase [Phycisphaerae bacterium]|nr:L-threonylcarbamoyladenylate synthase [Phycisphaerae bacterium]